MKRQLPKVAVRTIWRSEIGEKPFQFSPNFWSMKDGPGNCFIGCPPHLLFFANNSQPNQAYLIKVNLRNQKPSVIYQTEGYIEGVTFNLKAQKLLLITSNRLTDEGNLIILTPEGRLLYWVAIGERIEGRTILRVPAAPPLWVRLLDNLTLLVYSYGGRDSLFAFSLQGHLKREWQGVTGVAFDQEKKRLYVSGQVSGTGIHLVRLPKDMKSSTWRLVGADQHTHFYWYRGTDSHTWLACTDSHQARWIIPFSGAGGVLEKSGLSLSFGLGWGGDLLEVFPDGRIWFSSALLGVYELRVLDR